MALTAKEKSNPQGFGPNNADDGGCKVISSPYAIPETEWDLGVGEPSTPEQIGEMERVHAEMLRKFRERCADCGSVAHLAGSAECDLRFEF